MESRPPTHLSDLALACLEALARRGLGHAISLGGAVGLLHHLDYRPTRDVDAWWSVDADVRQRRRVLDVVEETLARHGQVGRRSWGEVVSIDLKKEGRIVFDFQIAERSAQLAESQPAGWVDVLLDSFPDLMSSKMVALVERGAPRDFRDVHACCRAGLVGAGECWRLWRRRQKAAGSDADFQRARLAVQTHLERIARHRPLSGIKEHGQRKQAQLLRQWFLEEFLNAVPD